MTFLFTLGQSFCMQDMSSAENTGESPAESSGETSSLAGDQNASVDQLQT